MFDNLSLLTNPQLLSWYGARLLTLTTKSILSTNCVITNAESSPLPLGFTAYLYIFFFLFNTTTPLSVDWRARVALLNTSILNSRLRSYKVMLVLGDSSNEARQSSARDYRLGRFEDEVLRVICQLRFSALAMPSLPLPSSAWSISTCSIRVDDSVAT